MSLYNDRVVVISHAVFLEYNRVKRCVVTSEVYYVVYKLKFNDRRLVVARHRKAAALKSITIKKEVHGGRERSERVDYAI